MSQINYKNFSTPSKLSLGYWLKLLDNIIGPLAVSICLCVKFFKNSNREIIVKNPKRILVIRPGGMGDAILLLPALNKFHQCFPKAEIHILAERRNASVFKGVLYIKKVYLYTRVLDLIMVLTTKYDLVIDSEQWHRLSSVIAYLSRAPVRIGFATNERSKLFTIAVPYSHNKYEVHSFLDLFRPVIGEFNINLTKPFLKIIKNFPRLDDSYLWVGIFPGASIVERRWPKERFRAIAKWLSKKNIKIAIIGGEQEEYIADYICRDISNCLNYCAKLTLLETASLISQLKLLLTGDSGIMHLSISVGTPVVALFGPGIQEKWAPRDGISKIINKHLPCSPCTKFGYTSKCPHNAKCMREITLNEVKGAINDLLGQTY